MKLIKLNIIRITLHANYGKHRSYFSKKKEEGGVERGCKRENLHSHSHDVTGRVAASSSKVEKFGYIS